jgi:hypothetical protein
MPEVRNVDEILVPREQAMVKNEQIPPQPAAEVLEQAQEPVHQVTPEPVPEPEPMPEAVKEEEPETDNKPTTEAHESPIDEYGNPQAKPRTYTEDEVQRMIRDRLSRGRHAEQPTQQQVQEAAKDFTPNPQSEESWEVQLEAFVEKTIEKRQQKLSEQQWRQQEAQKQAEFEEKFTTGMSKYDDFMDVTRGKPITDGIMLAARALDNPAAFIYGASKLHPQELSRIAQITDPYAQAAEVGRLHEKMVKARRTASQAGKPLETPKGDVPQKSYTRPSLESLIDQHAKQKRAR